MYERIYEYLLSEPRRLIGLGKSLVVAGGFILVIGTIGKVMAGVGAVMQHMGKQVAGTPDRAELYPSIPTWWVPESIMGCLPAVILMIVGFSLLNFGQHLKRAHF